MNKYRRKRVQDSLECLHHVFGQALGLGQAQIARILAPKDAVVAPQIGIRVLVVGAVYGIKVFRAAAMERDEEELSLDLSFNSPLKILDDVQRGDGPIVGQEAHNRVEHIRGTGRPSGSVGSLQR